MCIRDRLLTACAMAFAHGSNDVANAIGPLSSVVSIVENGGQILSGGKLTWWILPLGALGIAVGLIAMGQKVMATVGSGTVSYTHLDVYKRQVLYVRMCLKFLYA